MNIETGTKITPLVDIGYQPSHTITVSVDKISKYNTKQGVEIYEYLNEYFRRTKKTSYVVMLTCNSHGCVIVLSEYIDADYHEFLEQKIFDALGYEVKINQLVSKNEI